MITTYTGKFVNPLDLQPEDICIEDIAHALACVPRFAGHARLPISVGHHSIKVMEVVERLTKFKDGPEYWTVLMQALLHDATEAYLGDIPKWVKQTPTFAGYREAEDRASDAIMRRFGLPVELPEVVTEADKLLVRFEAEQAFDEYPFKPDMYASHYGYEKLGMVGRQLVGAWMPWDWKFTEARFLLDFRHLSSSLGFTYQS